MLVMVAAGLAAGRAAQGAFGALLAPAALAAAAPALGLGGAQPVEGALADQVAFHLGGHRGDPARPQHPASPRAVTRRPGRGSAAPGTGRRPGGSCVLTVCTCL